MNIDEVLSALHEVHYPEYKFLARIDGRGEMFLQGEYNEPCIDSGLIERQLTRRWFISPAMSKSELVQTAFKCIMTSMEHRVREHFQYRGELVYGPHFNVEDLWELAKTRSLAKR